jgi:hypothetical protein
MKNSRRFGRCQLPSRDHTSEVKRFSRRKRNPESKQIILEKLVQSTDESRIYLIGRYVNVSDLPELRCCTRSFILIEIP